MKILRVLLSSIALLLGCLAAVSAQSVRGRVIDEATGEGIPGVKVTLLVRTPGNNEADVLVSAEHDLQYVIDMVSRSMSRSAIGGPNVELVPRQKGGKSNA